METQATLDVLGLVIGSLTVGQEILALSVFSAWAFRRPLYTPLALFFAANLFTDLSSISAWAGPVFDLNIAILGFPAFMLLGPLLWLYVVALTSETRWVFERRLWRHFLLFVVASIIAMSIFSMPFNRKYELMLGDTDIDGGFELFVGVSLLFLGFVWIVQTAVYIAMIMRRLFTYRRRLHDVFASTQNLELGWLWWVLVLLGISWLQVMSSIMEGIFFSQSAIPEWLEDVVALAFVWTLAVWGLRQKPGFESLYNRSPAPDAAIQDKGKYERSALSAADSERIAAKIRTAMSRERLYANPNLSLRDLSAAIGVSANYVSQTLNETLERSFFDYVNGLRIQDAIPRVQRGEETVLHIAYDVGFNSRSSFYKAFKAETGQTPTAYRKTIADDANTETK